jgi:hypothetical protein
MDEKAKHKKPEDIKISLSINQNKQNEKHQGIFNGNFSTPYDNIIIL